MNLIACGKWGIQTPDTHKEYTGFRVQRIRSLCQLSFCDYKINQISSKEEDKTAFFYNQTRTFYTYNHNTTNQLHFSETNIDINTDIVDIILVY